jgi:hypothetical protein
MRDERIHYAVNCASIGCPTLPMPFTAANLQQMLDRGARLFVNHLGGVRVERGGLTVSSIYRWYQADFGGNWQGVGALMKIRRAGDCHSAGAGQYGCRRYLRLAAERHRVNR